jgi:hypothetical protein
MRPAKVYRGSRQRLKRLRIRDHWSVTMWALVIWLGFLLLVAIPWMVHRAQL